MPAYKEPARQNTDVELTHTEGVEQNDRPRIFISYARKDRAWVTDIVRALETDGFDAWIDLDDLPEAEDWEKDIIRNIRRMQAFVFMISRHSVASGMCNTEIEHALRNGKRIIPVFIGRTKDGKVGSVLDKFLDEKHRQEIQSRNFIFCRQDQDDFRNAIEKIRQAFFRDHQWVIFHTWLQEKARDWDERPDHSRLLRGAELKEVEQQLAVASNKDPQPTDLQRLYLLKSQEAAARARRQTTVALGIGLALTSILCVAAVVASFIAAAQRNLAVSRENARATAQALAEQQANIALSRQLVAEAQLVYDQQTDGPLIASLLAIESQLRVPNAAADEIIRKSSEIFLPRFRNIPVPAGQLTTSLAFSPDGASIAAGDFDGTARVWDVNSGDEIALLQHRDRVHHVKFSTDGQKLFTASEDGIIRVWEIASGEEIMQIDHGRAAAAFALTPDGTKMVTGGIDEIVEVWDAESLTMLSSIANNAAVASVAISPDGSLVAAINVDNSATVWDSGNGKEIFHTRFDGFAPQSLSFSPDGRQLLSGGYYIAGVEMWDLETGTLDFKLEAEGAGIFSPDGKTIAVGHRSGEIEIRDARTGKLIRSVAHDFAVQAMSFSPDGRYLASSSDDGSTRLWEIGAGREAGRMLQDGEVLASAFSPDGSLIAAAGVDGTIHLWRAPSIGGSLWQSADPYSVRAEIDAAGRQIAAWDGTSGRLQIVDLAANVPTLQIPSESSLDMEFSPDGESIAMSTTDGAVCVWEISGGQKTACYTQNEAADVVLFSPDSKWVASTEDQTIHIWDAGTGQEVTSLTSNYRISAFAFCPGRSWLAIGSLGDYKVEVWDIGSGEMIAELAHDPSVNIGDVTFSPDGRWLISSGIDGTARVWDMETLGEQSRMTYDPFVYENRAAVLTTKISPDQIRLVSVNTLTHMTANNNPTTLRESEIRVWDLASGEILSRMVYPAWVDDIGWSPDGRSVYSVGQDGIVSIWDAAEGNEIAHITYDSKVLQFRFTPDGRQVLAVEADGTYAFSSWQSGDVAAGACSYLSRNLTRLEWSQYFGGIPYHATCPDLPTPAQ